MRTATSWGGRKTSCPENLLHLRGSYPGSLEADIQLKASHNQLSDNKGRSSAPVAWLLRRVRIHSWSRRLRTMDDRVCDPCSVAAAAAAAAGYGLRSALLG